MFFASLKAAENEPGAYGIETSIDLG